MRERAIPNVHFLEPSPKEEDVWTFHNAIDVLAHYRRDGETQGLNINEAMLARKPIITHKSKHWNAHLEYLDESFSFIAEMDNSDQYAEFMNFFALYENKDRIKEMGNLARDKAIKLFLPEESIGKIEEKYRRNSKIK